MACGMMYVVVEVNAKLGDVSDIRGNLGGRLGPSYSNKQLARQEIYVNI